MLTYFKFLKKITKVILIVVGIFITLLILFFFISDVQFYQIPVRIKETGETIYLKEKSIGRDYTEIVISPHKGRTVKSQRDYLYTWNETLFYKIEGNIIYVLCSNKAKFPPNFGKHVRVIQNTYSNPEYYDMLNNYNQKGYQKFPLSRVEKAREKRISR